MRPNEYFGYIVLVLLMLLITWTISCSGRPGKTIEEKPEPVITETEQQTERLIKILSPSENEEYKTGNQIKISLAPEVNARPPDSVKIHFDGRQVSVLKSAPWEYTVPSGLTGTTGRKSVKAVGYRNKRFQTITLFIIVFSDIIPKNNGFKIVHTYPHDSEAFTQGLFYDNGFLYEGTGQEAGSSLREVEIESGKVLRQLHLKSSLFGEGITLYGNRIYQVTWQNKVGFVYDKNTFRQINKIYYQTQGWGLTTMSDKIVMSDGSNVLYFFEPELFTVVSRIEVYDHEKKVDQLNELEYINGEIWANIWMSDLIARIDPATGKVNSYINLTTLYPEARRRETGSDVLNGIAYDPQGKRIFVTGKRWPKLYEIRITE
jgi:glutamine cyclotransferase